MEPPIEPPPELTPDDAVYPRDSFDLSRSRTPIGWIALVLLFGLMIFAELKAPAAKKAEKTFSKSETSIRLAMRLRELPLLAGSNEKTLDETIETLRDEAKKHHAAARLLVTAEYEANGKVPKADLELLRNFRNPQDQAFAEVYSSEKLTRERLALLSPRLGKDFSGKVAAIHASEKAGDSAPRKAFSPLGKTYAFFGLGFAMFGAGLIGLCLWLVYAAMKTSGKLESKGHPADPITPAEGDRFALRAAILVAAFLTVTFVVAAASSQTNLADPTRIFLSTVAFLALIPILLRLPVMGLPIPARRIGLSSEGFFKNVAWGVAAWCATLPLILVAGLIGTWLARVMGQEPSHPAIELLRESQGTGGVLALAFAAVISAPLWEEIAFRGTLLPAISSLFGKAWVGIVLSSFIFASIHPQGVPLWLALGTIGAMSCVVAYQTKSLIPSITLHALNNGVILALNLLMN